MTSDQAIAFGIGIIAAGIAVLIGLLLRRSHRPTSTISAAPPPPPAGFRPRDVRHEAPLLSTYEGSARLQRARRAASEFIAEIGATNEILPLEVTGVPRTGPRPLGPIDVDAMTRKIVSAWIGDEEPMVSVPIMKLSDIRPGRNEQASGFEKPGAVGVKDIARTAATGGMVKPGRPYIVGETPSEQTRPQTDDQDEG